MKVYEILPEQQIDENAWRNALAAGVLGVSALSPSAITKSSPSDYKPSDEMVSYGRQSDVSKFEVDPQIEQPKTTMRRTELARNIARTYHVKLDLAQEVVNLAFEHEDDVFPKAEDILAVIGIESSFNPESVSSLRKDPARGLMQVRPGVWNIDPENLNDVESQIEYGVNILKHYYKKTGNREDTLHAYNLGLTKFRRGGRNPSYVAKVKRERGQYD